MTITTGPERRPAPALPPELSPRPARVDQARTFTPGVRRVQRPPTPAPTHRGRWSWITLGAGSATVLAIVVMAAGSGIDAVAGDSMGAATTSAFLLICCVVPLLLRRPASVTPLALPPLAWGGEATAAALLSGQNTGRREVALDVATMLTITAPTLFGGTLLAVVLAIGRLVVRRTRRPRSPSRSGDAGRAHVSPELGRQGEEQTFLR